MTRNIIFNIENRSLVDDAKQLQIAYISNSLQFLKNLFNQKTILDHLELASPCYSIPSVCIHVC